jgi:type II secretory pathway component GspD/PulD (secretin)
MSKWAGRAVFIFLLLVVCLGSVGAETDNTTVSDIFFNTFIVDALNDISVQTGIPIIADSTVSGFVTLELVDVPLEDALSRVCVPFGYTFRFMPGGYYLVGVADAKNPTFGLLSDTIVIKTNYLKAETVSKLLSDFYKPFIKADNTLNTLVVTASPEMLERIAADVKRIDIPIRQVLLEVLVIELSGDARKNLGTEWQWKGEKPKGEDSSGTLKFTANVLASVFSELTYAYPAGITSFLFSLKPMVENGEAKIHANPRIVTMDGHQADIFLGQEQSYLVLTESDSGTTVTRQRVIIKTGVTLNFLPQISPLGDITVKVEPEVSATVGFNKDGYPIISSRRANTTVRIKDGQTFVIGGLLHEFESQTVGKVPILGDIPLFGRLFRTERTEKSETEVVIMVTPHIIEEGM